MVPASVILYNLNLGNIIHEFHLFSTKEDFMCVMMLYPFSIYRKDGI